MRREEDSSMRGRTVAFGNIVAERAVMVLLDALGPSNDIYII